MNKKQLLNEKFSFIDFNADPLSNLLIKHTKEKRLEPKVMSLLILLASRSGEVVSRAEILENLWPNVVVGDEVISQLIYALRNALGDDAKNPQYIETIPKKGYRFIVEIKIIETKINTKPTTDTGVVPTKNIAFNLKAKVLLGSCLLIILILTIIWFSERVRLQHNEQTLIIDSILPVTQKTGVEGDFAFYKDHNKMVYVSSTEDSVDLYIKRLTTNDFLRLTNDSWEEYSPLWLTENTLVYVREKLGQYQIIRHKLQQGAEVLYESTKFINSLALNSTKLNELTFIEYDEYNHDRLLELKSLNFTNGEIQYLHDSLLNLPSEVFHPLYAEDGKTLYFYDRSVKMNKIVALNLKDNRYTTITEKFNSVRHISLIDSQHILISGQLSTTKGIWKVNINDNSITSILPSTGGGEIVRAVIKNGQLFYATYKASQNQKIADIKTQTIDPLPNLNSDANEFSGTYSQDNNTIYFVSSRTGYNEIWAYDVKSQQTKQVSHVEASSIYRPILSHAKDYLAVVYQKETLVLAVISVATGKPISKTSIPSRKFPLAWSKNDESIFISEHQGEVNIYQYDRDTLQPKLIQKKAGLFAQQSADRTTLTLVDYKFGGVIKKNLRDKKITPLNNSLENLVQLVPGQLKVINQSIIAVKNNGYMRQIQQYPLVNNEVNSTEASEGKLLMDLPNGAFVTDFNANGSKVLFTTRASPQGDIMKVILSK